MEKLMTALLLWASSFTGLPVPDELPNVRFADGCQIERLYYGDGERECAGDIAAIYNPMFRTIYLPDTWSADNMTDVSTLLHELVHHVQFSAGLTAADYTCAAEMERQAYDAELAWLKAARVEDPMAVVGIPPITYFMVTRCLTRPPYAPQ